MDNKNITFALFNFFTLANQCPSKCTADSSHFSVTTYTQQFVI